MQAIPGQSSRLCRWALLLVCLAAFFLRFQGANWPAFHPDELSIGAGIDKTARGASMKGPPYAHGFFVLVKPAIWISRGFDYVHNYGAFQRGLKDRVGGTENNILVARWFNVWAGTLVSLIGFLLIRRVTRSPWAGVFGAALLGLAQYPVEHSHYGETDIAMLLTLTTALWLMAVAADTGQKRNLVLAALAGGFAAGTKFQLVLLLPVILALALTSQARPPTLKRLMASAAGGLSLALVCFLLGFLLAMPQALDLDWFIKGLAAEKARVYGEAVRSLGPLQGHIWVRYAVHLRELREYLQTPGWPWLVLVAAGGLPCLVLRDYRRYLPITLLFPGLYLVYFVFLSPWVRSQEFMAFLPCFALLAALPLVLLWRSQRFVLRLAILHLGLAALAMNGINGSRAASLFAWTDTRVLARQWLQAHLPGSAGALRPGEPARSTVATENYAEGAWPESEKPPICIYKIEKDGLETLTQQGADYLLRAVSITGRGLRNPLTGLLFPAPQELFDEFSRNSERLRVWAPLPPQGLATFVSPAIELYGLRKPAPPEHQIDLELPQPLWLSDYYDAEKGRQTFFPIGHKLGAATGLLIDRRERVIAVGGPGAPRSPIFLVLNTAERGATVIIRGFGQKRRVVLSPYDAAVVPLQRSAWQPRLKQFEEITLRTERVRDVLYIPCFARVAFSPAEVARICLDLSQEEALWRAFSEAELLSACDPATAYLLAVRSSRWALAEQLTAAVEPVEKALSSSARADPAALAINGNSAFYYNEFARVRLNEARTIIDLHEDGTGRMRGRQIETFDVLDLTAPGLYEAVLQLPVFLARGRYTFFSEVMVKTEASTNQTHEAIFEFYSGEPKELLARHEPPAPGAWTSCAFEFPVLRETQPRFIVRAHAPMRLYFRNTEIRWTLKTMLAAVRDDLVVARATHDVAGGKFGEAQRSLDGLRGKMARPRIQRGGHEVYHARGVVAPYVGPQLAEAIGIADHPITDPFRWNELEIRQLDLAIARALGNSEASRQAAQRLLQLAPGDYTSLQTLKEMEPAFPTTAHALAANLKTPIEFGAEVNLVGFIFDSTGRRVQCVWEARKNGTPPFAATFWIRRHGEWRKKQVCPLSDRLLLAKGERVAVDIVLDEKFTGYTTDTIALGLETAVEWHPGVLPVVGSREGVVPFAALLRR